MAVVTRFAPSPTGPLHLGHAYAAILAHDLARAEGGHFMLRIEDIDQSRCRPVWEAQIYDDLRWLGLQWEEPVLRQSDRLAVYQAALDRLWRAGLLYPCTCSRRDISEAASAPQEAAAPLPGPNGLIYPGTCRSRTVERRTFPEAGSRPRDAVLRLDMALATGFPQVFDHRIDPAAGGWQNFAGFRETGLPGYGAGRLVGVTSDEMIHGVGDIVLARREMGTSYHLSVVLDDAAQAITHVTRGEDLFEATRLHVVLQRLLGLPTPIYHHHRLIRDSVGRRLAKRDDARSLSTYRAEGTTPADIRLMLGL